MEDYTPYEQSVQAFEAVVGELNARNGSNPLWWYTWISNRDRFRSRLLDRIAQSYGIPPRTPLPSAWRDYLLLAKSAARNFRRWYVARRHHLSKTAEADVVIVSILNERKLAATDDYIDEYFGKLPGWLVEKEHKPLIIGFNEGDDDHCASLLAKPRPVKIESFAQHISPKDIVFCAVRAATCSFKNVDARSDWPDDIKSMVKHEFQHQRMAVFEGLIFNVAINRVLKANPAARVLHMFENNAWERASYIAAKRASPARQVTGYLHCAILRSHRKYYFPQQEHRQRPMPDKIVTTGPGAARALEAIGDYPDGMIAHDGVSLRDQINPENPAQPKHKIQKILVLLEGLTSIAPLLDVVCEAAKQNPDLAFTLRCHPQLPYDAAVSLMSSPDDGRRFLQESKHESLLAAIRWSDADIYSSSTAVFSALALGKPVIFIPTDAFYNNDALHYSQGLARTAKTPGELLAALAELDQLSDQAYSELIQKGATFCTDAMATANASAIALFETNSRQGH